MYTYLIILCINSIVATPRYTYIDYEYGSTQQNVSPPVPVTSITNEQPIISNTKIAYAITTSTTPTLTRSLSNQEIQCTSSATTILDITPSNYAAQLPTTQSTASTSTSISASTSLTQNDLQENNLSSINDHQPALTPESSKTTANISGSAIENTNQRSSYTNYSTSPVQTTPPNSTLININSQPVLANITSIVSANSSPTPVVDSVVSDFGLYGDSDNELEYLQQQVHDGNNPISSSNQTYNDDSDEVVLTSNSGIIYGYGYDNTPYE